MKTYKITAILVVLFFLLANSKITSAQIAPGGTGEVTIIKTTSATITSVYVGSAVGSNAMYIASNSSGTYSKSGTRLTIRFNVTLTNDAPSGQTLSVNFMVLIISSGGMSNLPEAVSITVAKPSTPAAGFSGTPTSGTAPLSVQFTDQSTGDIASRLWDFGDGGTSTVQNPQHTYSSAGIFTVKLKVTNATGLGKNPHELHHSRSSINCCQDSITRRLEPDLLEC